MRRLTILIFIISSAITTWGQDYIQINPIRALLGEVHIFYEQSLKKNKNSSIIYKLGFIYPLTPLNEASAFHSRFGMVGYLDGLNTGALAGLAYRRYFGSQKKFFYQFGVDIKYFTTTDFRAIYSYTSTADYTALVSNGRSYVLNPKLSAGIKSQRWRFMQSYLGLGASIRNSQFDIGTCSGQPQSNSDCRASTLGQHPSLEGTSFAPSVHIGILLNVISFGNNTKK